MTSEQHRDEDMKGAMAALLRAAKRAKKLARQTGTALVVMRDGKLVQEIPPPEDHGKSTVRSAQR